MNALIRSFGKTACLASILSCGGALAAFGGEAIIISKPSTRPSAVEPVPSSRLKTDSLSFTRQPASSPFESIAPPPQIRIPPGNPNLTTRQKNELIERKNWMLYDRGELQQREEERSIFGIRDDNGITRDSDSYDRTFERKDDDRAGRSSSRLLTAAARRKAENRRTEKQDVDLDEDQGTPGKLFETDKSDDLGAHTLNELNLQTLFKSGETKAAVAAARGESLTLRDLFNAAGDAARSRAHDERMNNFRDLLNMDRPDAPSFSTLQPLGGLQNFNAPQRSAPLTPPAAVADSARFADRNPLAPNQNWNALDARQPAAALPSLGGSPASLFPTPSATSPNRTPDRAPSWVQPTTLEMPKRKL